MLAALEEEVVKHFQNPANADSSIGLTGFGSFRLRHNRPRNGYNAHSKSRTLFKASSSIKFRMSRSVKIPAKY